jgi:hypothetical protein
MRAQVRISRNLSDVYQSYSSSYNYGSAIIGIIFIIVGAVIIALGALASILKVSTELVVEETIRELRRQP